MENAMQPPLPPPPPPAFDVPQSSGMEQTVTHELTFGMSGFVILDSGVLSAEIETDMIFR